jgi:gluconate 2-dehydrogenase gamma chain
MDASVSRRRFLAQGAGGLSAAWVSAHWPAFLAAATHARHAAQSAAPAKFEFFTADEAKEIDAITSRIIPSDATPGGLTTFDVDNQKTYREGLPELQARVAEMVPGTSKFSALTPEQQDEVLHSFDDQSPHGRQRRFRPSQGAQNFFETLRQHTIAGFLIDPDYGGNRDGAGWKVIGRAREYMFQPPFGYYDKGYPGWEVAAKEEMKEAEKK